MNEISKAEMAGYLAVMMSWVPRDHQKEQIYRAIYAVIKAALRPKVVTKIRLAVMATEILRLAPPMDSMDRQVLFIEQVRNYLAVHLRELGIEVEL